MSKEISKEAWRDNWKLQAGSTQGETSRKETVSLGPASRYALGS